MSDYSISIFTAEYQLWKNKLLAQQSTFTAIETLQERSVDISPNIHKVLKILVTMPITTKTAERSFFSCVIFKKLNKKQYI